MSGITNEDLDALLTRLEQRRRDQPDATADQRLGWLLAGIDAIEARTFPSATAFVAVHRLAATLGVNAGAVFARAYALRQEHPVLSPGDALLHALSEARPDPSDGTPT